MEDAIAEIDSRDLSDGVLFAAWFLNNPNGPTASALGYTTANQLFYRWLHFLAGRTWLIGSFDPAAAGDLGQAMFDAAARFHNDDAVHAADESPMFRAFPSFIITNGEPQVDLYLRELLEVSLSRADWSQEFYLIQKYGIDFYGRAAVETQHAYKRMRSDPAFDPTNVERLASAFEQAHGAVDDIPEQLPLVTPGPDAAAAWWRTASQADVVSAGLGQFAEMWAGATWQFGKDNLTRLRQSGDAYTPFSDVVDFFARYQMSLWPAGLSDRSICESLGLSTTHLEDDEFDEQLARRYADTVSVLLDVDSADPKSLSAACEIYSEAVEHLDEEFRRSLYMDVNGVVGEEPSRYQSLLPVVLRDTDKGLASTAAIDVLAYSPPGDDGLPTALAIIDDAIASGALANVGAVFGGLVAFADARLRPTLRRLVGSLSDPALDEAVKTTTGALFHDSVEFWLEAAERYAKDPSDEGLRRFGSAASALAVHRLAAQRPIVLEIRRLYPSRASDQGIEVKRQWTLDEYAEFIGPRLYALEAAEAPPRVLSEVLAIWGLEPRAPVAERYGFPR